MTELSFLIELLLNHDLQKATKDLIAERIKEVERNLQRAPTLNITVPAGQNLQPPSLRQVQCQSTLDAIARQEAVGHTSPAIHAQQLPPEMPPIPVEQIAQTPAAAQAMNSRNRAIAASIAGKVDKEAGRPRKW